MAPKAKAPKRSTDTAAGSAPEKKKKTGLAVGDMLPAFEVETDEETKITSTDLVAESGAVIFFYPKANTGGCTTQACGFRDNYEKLVSSGYKVYGMSADKPKSQANWKAKHNFQYPLLCDPSFQVLKALGVNKGDKGIRRSHIVIAKGGKVEQLHYDISPKDSVAEAAKLIASNGDAAKEAEKTEETSAGEAVGKSEAEAGEPEAAAESEGEAEVEAEKPAEKKKAKGKAKAASGKAAGGKSGKAASGKAKKAK